jgi:hypothetical protein
MEPIEIKKAHISSLLYIRIWSVIFLLTLIAAIVIKILYTPASRKRNSVPMLQPKERQRHYLKTKQNKRGPARSRASSTQV